MGAKLILMVLPTIGGEGKAMASIASTGGHHEGQLPDAVAPGRMGRGELASRLPAGRGDACHRLASQPPILGGSKRSWLSERRTA